jgi:protein O-mannosyl-transferase
MQKGSRPAEGRNWRVWLLFLALLMATLLAYYPAWHGGMLWDDDRHITRSDLRSAEGLRRIWFDLGATQQYYPLVHSAFWLQYKIWGDDTLGYHLVNIVLHALAAFLVGLILRRLAVPGAYLAALVFALHPVQVESVAWITELKNTLSGVCYLGSAWFYLQFDAQRKGRLYALSLGLFVLALLSKTVTATLPAVLLVVFWWRRGKLSWNRDLRPLIPWCVIGIAAGLFTAWVERTMVGAHGVEYQYSILERTLIAGRVVWFYLGKLIWPRPLIFIYPRWQVSQGAGWQYIFPIALAGLTAALWLLRSRARAPLACLLIFSGTLFPVMGFFNVFPFRYSFVADHFQYLACIAMFALFSAAVVQLMRRWWRPSTLVAISLAGMIGVLLAIPTWSQSRQYQSDEVLYRSTIALNPACWMAHNNLGNVLQRQGRFDEAVVEHREALRHKRDYAEACNNLGTALQGLNQSEAAVAQFQAALRIDPNFAGAHLNLGNALQGQGKIAEAVEQYRMALRFEPESVQAQGNLGAALTRLGQSEEAVVHLQEAIRLQPRYAIAYNNLGKVFQKMGRFEEAVTQHEKALRIDPKMTEAYAGLGAALQQLGRAEEALAVQKDALRMRPDSAEACIDLGNAYLRMGRFEEAVKQYETALRIRPGFAVAHFNLGNAMQAQGRSEESAQQYLLAIQLMPDLGEAHYNLGQLMQRLGRLDEAVTQFKEAVRCSPASADAQNNLGVTLAMRGSLDLALPHFKEAVRLKPDFSDAKANLARALAALKNR